MVYVHIPFCKSFCTYCGFYSEICDDKVQKLFVDALLKEAEERRGEIQACLEAGSPRTLYIGGGTPSLLEAEAVAKVAAAAGGGGLWKEFTMEANPEDIVSKGERYAEALLEAGVNRFSLGVQSFDDEVLRRMNRRHDARRAAEAVRLLRRAGAGNLSIDLIFGLPDWSAAKWRDTVKKALDLAPDHISAYQLSVEPDSVLSRRLEEGVWKEAGQEECRECYEILCEELGAAGYRHYEISNFALPGREAVHNSAYWRRVPYVGLGPGAHSFDGVRRSWNSQRVPAGWTREFESLSAEDARVEELMLYLRTDNGISANRAEDLCNPEVINTLLADGSLVRSSDRLRIPESNFFISDDIIRRLI